MRGTNAYNLPDSGGTSFKTRFPLLAAIIITVLVAAGLAAFLIWVGYSFLLRPSTRLDGIGYRDLVEVVKIALAVVAGIGGTAALTVAVRKQKVAERQHKLSEADANRQDRRMLDERFQNAVEQLGKTDSAAVRIGGAYSLAKLADDWPAERQTCINVLCGYLRFPYDLSSCADGEREVRQTIVGIVRQHLLQGAEVSWDGYLFDFSGAVLDHLDLSDVYLEESTLRLCSCRVQGATFKMKGLRVVGGEVDARDLRIMDGATLDARGCYLSDSGRISLAGSTISSGTVTFEDAHIDGGRLELDNAKIDGCGILNLSHLRITSVPLGQKHPSPLSLDEAEISGGTVNLERIRITRGPDQPEVTWSGGREKEGRRLVASFHRLNLTGGRISFNGTKIPYGEFSFNNADFSGGVLDFEDSLMADCCLNFSGAKIKGGYLNFSNSHIGPLPSSDTSPRSGFAYEWLEDLKNVKDVSNRCMNRKKRPYGVVMFWDAELDSGHLNFDGAVAQGTLLQFSGMRASGGKIVLTGMQFEALAISFWNADLSGECEIEIRSRYPPAFPDVTVLYSQAYGGLNGRVTLGERIELLEVSAAD